jgi:flagellar L-ring protein precursor FlgH
MNAHESFRLDKLAIAGLLAAALSGCQTMTRVSEIGTYPNMSPIANPTTAPGYRPVNLPIPPPQPLANNPNSLCRPGARAVCKDTRAKDVGDTLTVRLKLDDSAKLQNGTKRKREEKQGLGVEGIFGFEGQLHKILPNNVDNANLVAYGSKLNTDGDGDIARKENVALTFAAMVTQVLPNGFLVILGRQEMRVDYEMRELMLTGVVRPQDIDADNSIPDEKIAEMRVAYGGRGTLSELQQPRWGTQLLDVLLPF